MIGTIIRSTGSWYEVKLDESNKVLPCRIVGKFRLNDKQLTNPVAVGDRVDVNAVVGEDSGMIVEILDRKNYVVRQSPRKKHFLHILAANIDQAVVIVTMVEPNLKQGFIDRFLLMTEPYNIPVHIVFNKVDLYSEDDIETFEYLQDVYHAIGHKCSLVSAEAGTGLDAFKDYLKGKLTLIAGQSGVGKSTLINAVQPQFELRTSEISDHSGKGQHTTTFAEMFELDFGGRIIDTPGIKTLAFNHFEIMDVAHNFREIFLESKNCKYGDCTHRNEPNCAVKEAVEEGSISELRYNNYVQLVEEVEDQNYWERKTDY